MHNYTTKELTAIRRDLMKTARKNHNGQAVLGRGWTLRVDQNKVTMQTYYEVDGQRQFVSSTL